MKALVPIDGSETSLKISRTVHRLLDLQPEMEVHLAMVLDPKIVKGRTEHAITETPAAAIGKMSLKSPLPRLVESHGEAMERRTAETRGTLETMGHQEFPGSVTVAHTVWSEHPAEAINELAEKIDADVIVMATHGRSGFSHLLAGSVTEGVMRTATRPVLVQGPKAV